MRLRRAIWAIACTLLLAGCLPVTSKTPVGTTTGLGADDALYGTWKGYGEPEHVLSYIHFLPKKGEGIGAVLVNPKSDSDDGSVGLFLLRTSKLGANSFINVVKIYNGMEENDSSWGELNDASVPMLYKFGKNHTLTLYLLDEDKAKEAIQAGKLSGAVESGNFGDVKITSDAAALDAFMATPEAAKLFKVFLVLKKAE